MKHPFDASLFAPLFSSAVLPLSLVLIVLLLAGCTDRADLSSTESPQSFTVRVELDGGIVTTPPDLAGVYPAGTLLSYAFVPTAGYADPVVLARGELVPSAGEITVDEDLIFFASADVLPDAVPADDPVRAAAEAMLGAADPAAAFQEYLNAIVALENEVGEDSAQAHAARVEATVFDWARNGDAMLRASERMHGETFTVPAVIPEAAEARTSRSSGTTDREDDQMVRTTFIHTNGILTSQAAAAEAAIRGARVLAEAGLHTHGLAPGTLPAERGPRLTYLLNYNHTLGLLGGGENHCEAKLLAELERRGAAYMATLLASGEREIERRLGCSFRHDVIETIEQMANILLGFPAPSAGDARRLADLAIAWREVGHNVVLAGHSQGNLMTIEALQNISPLEDGRPNCVSYVSVAPPLLSRTEPADRTDGILVGHGNAVDFVALLPGPKPQPSSSAYARDLSRKVALVGLLPVPAGLAAAKLWAGIKLHNFSDGYLRPKQEAREWFGGVLGSHYEGHAARCSGGVTGRVIDGLTREPIANAEVRPSDPPTAPPLAHTAVSGVFALGGVEARRQAYRISAHGYIPALLDGVEPRRFEMLTVPEIPLVPSGSQTGGVAGTVIDARDTHTLGGAIVELRPGVSAATGPPAALAASDAEGRFKLLDVPAGTYTLSVAADGYVSDRRTGLVVADSVLKGQDIALSPADGDLRIKLTWSEAPADLDAHLSGPTTGGERFHVYWEQAGDTEREPFAALDVDDRNGRGPETITVRRIRSGNYRFSVHDYSTFDDAESTVLSESGARVQVYREGALWQDFAVPFGRGVVWSVFEMQGGKLKPLNRIHASPAFNAMIGGERDGTGALPAKPPIGETAGSARLPAAKEATSVGS